MSKRVAELLINVNSRKSRSFESQVMAALAKYNFTITHINKLKKNQPLAPLLKNILARRPALLIVGGGDGTISDVVDLLKNKDIALGIIPLGTTNNFARSLNIPLDVDSAVQMIQETSARSVDLGRINDDHFTNVAGIGLSALVARNVTHKAKQRLGRFAYSITGLVQLFKHKPFMVTIQDKDHELKLNFETHQVIIANGRFHAGKQIALDAKVDNRELIVFALGGRSKLSFIWSLLDFYIGKRKKVIHASYLIARNIELHTQPKQLIELDGELKFTTPLQASVVSNAIKVHSRP